MTTTETEVKADVRRVHRRTLAIHALRALITVMLLAAAADVLFGAGGRWWHDWTMSVSAATLVYALSGIVERWRGAACGRVMVAIYGPRWATDPRMPAHAATGLAQAVTQREMKATLRWHKARHRLRLPVFFLAGLAGSSLLWAVVDVGDVHAQLAWWSAVALAVAVVAHNFCGLMLAVTLNVGLASRADTPTVAG